MTDIGSGADGITHNILVYGYQEDGDLIYMDPYDGTSKVIDSSYVVGNYNIVIIGIK